jgi:glycosyltransferase involved in cell wall biosynthesis
MFRLSGQILTASTAGHRMMCSLGIPESRISMTLDTVDNDWWIAEAARADREMVRRSWNVGPDEKVILFCAKLQPWKCPMDVLQAFAKMGIPNSKLVFAGDGAMRSQLEAEAQAPGLAGRVRFLGFVNQSQLPGVYKAADLMVIASRYEPFGLVVNEAMLCGCAVVASDRVGAVADLVTEGRTGFVYRCGDIDELADALAKALGDPGHLSVIRAGAFERMKEWSPSVSVKAVVDAVARAVARAGGTPGGQESTGGAA